MAESIITAFGYQGDLYVYDDRIIIKRPSSASYQRKEIKYEQIKEIKYEEPKGINRGYVCFELKDYQGDSDNTIQFINGQKPKIVEALHIIRTKFLEITNNDLYIGNGYRHTPLAQAVKAEKSKQTINSWIVFIVIGLIGWWIFSSMLSNKANNATSKTISITASVSYTGTQIIIANNDSFNWDNTSISINPGILTKATSFDTGYSLDVGTIKPNNIYRFGILNFAKSDGTRFNPFQTKPQMIVITCKTPTGEDGTFGGKFQ